MSGRVTPRRCSGGGGGVQGRRRQQAESAGGGGGRVGGHAQGTTATRGTPRGTTTGRCARASLCCSLCRSRCRCADEGAARRQAVGGWHAAAGGTAGRRAVRVDAPNDERKDVRPRPAAHQDLLTALLGPLKDSHLKNRRFASASVNSCTETPCERVRRATRSQARLWTSNTHSGTALRCEPRGGQPGGTATYNHDLRCSR